MTMSFNSNIRNKINALNNNTKLNNSSSKPAIKVTNSISEKIKKLSSSTSTSSNEPPALAITNASLKQSSKETPKDKDIPKDIPKETKPNTTPPISSSNNSSSGIIKANDINVIKEINVSSNNADIPKLTSQSDLNHELEVSDPNVNIFSSESFIIEKDSSGNGSLASTIDYPFLAEEEDSSISLDSSTLLLSSLNADSTILDSDDLNTIRKKLAEVQYINRQLKLENETLHEELQDIRNEMEELQDQFRLDDADEFRQLQAELEIAAKNCRILQFKLRKLEKKNEFIETDKIILQDKLDEFSREANKLIDLEEELLVAKEVSIRLNGELEQAQEWRSTTEKLNKELKRQLDDLKDYIDIEIKSRNATEDYNELVLVNKLYESMFREYFLQEQLYSLSNNSQTQNVNKQLREVTDLINSYQQKIALLNEEIDIIKHQLINKDKELDQLKIQLKNLKRSRSSDSGYERNRRQLTLNNSILNGKSNSNTSIDTSGAIIIHSSNNNNNMPNEPGPRDDKKHRGSESSDGLTIQLQMANDEIRLLRNKIARLEDDLVFATQEKENLTVQLETIEDKAMKSFTTIVEHEADTELDLDSALVKQMNELKKKIDLLNVEAKTNEDSKTQLSTEIKLLKDQLEKKLSESVKNDSCKNLKEESKERDDSDTETIKNLTDSDKLLRDECKSLKTELENRNETLSRMQSELKQNFSVINELKKLIEIKEASLNESIKRETQLNQKLEENTSKLNILNKKIEDYEISLKKLKHDYELKLNLENEINSDNTRLSSKISDMNNQLQDKISEIEFLNRENNALQERINLDDSKLKRLETDLSKLRFKIDDLNTDLESKNKDVVKLEKMIKSKENEFGAIHRRIVNKEFVTRDIHAEFDKNRNELLNLQAKYTDLSASLDDKVNSLTKEIQRLNKDKESLYNDLTEFKIKHEKCGTGGTVSKSDQIETEINHEKAILQKLEVQTISTKYETKIQYLEVEIDTLRSKIKKLLREKETQDQVLKENQKLVKDIALKYATDSDTWNRHKQKLLEKEKLYEESVDMRKELKKAADKLRQKLQSLEDQIIDKQNKHTIEKNNWETQKIQFISSNNKLEEQLSKLSTLKRSKKEIDFAWDKERRDFVGHVKNLEEFIKDLQSQLAQKNTSMSQVTDQYSQNEKIQSLFGENEFLKNRIRELEIMLDEMDQVKRFLFDIKEAYEVDRHEWMYAKDDFRHQIEIKENLLIDCNMKLNEIINVVRAMQMNEPIPPNGLSLGPVRESSNNDDSNETSNKNESLNNLVGGTSNLLELKFGRNGHNRQKSNTSSFEHSTSSKNNLSRFASLNEQNVRSEDNFGSSELQIVDFSKDGKELDTEFDQAFKKINRVRENLSTHKKFMDIVKSLPNNEAYQGDSPSASRGSVPPESMLSQTMNQPGQRAKSMSKEPVSRDSSTSSSVFAPSRFFSLGRRFAKIRFTSSSQPPPPSKSPLTAKSTSNISTSVDAESSKELLDLKQAQLKKSKQMTQSQLIVPSSSSNQNQDNSDKDERSSKKNLRERALSPSKILRSLRPRSPFGRSNRNIKASSLAPTSTTMILGTSGDISGKNKSFTVGNTNSNSKTKSELLMSASYHSEISEPTGLVTSNSIANRFIRATTAGPASLNERSNQQNPSQTDKLRSLSCEFIDNNLTSTSSQLISNSKSNLVNNVLKQLNETLDEYDESDNNSILTASSYSTHLNNSNTLSQNRPQNLNGVKPISKVEALRKNFMENGTSLSQNSEIVKSVKFKDPPEKVSPSETDNETSSNKKYAESSSDETKETQTQAETNSENEKEKIATLNSAKKLNVKFGSTTTSVDESNSKPSFLSQQRLKASFSTNHVDKPPKGPIQQTNSPNPSTFSFRNKFTNNKAKTIDFPDLLQSAIESTSNNQKSKNATLFTASGKPIQSILRRSETPPNTKVASMRQTSVESNESARETSIEKLLKTTSSTSRPLMFNN